MEPIEFGSVCSGIEAASVALEPIGFKAVWFAEIESFPAAVLKHHYPDTPNHGDMRKLAAMVLSGRIPAPSSLWGGTPCQAFSVAGMREGLNDPRGELTIKYVELADAVDFVRTRRGEPECVIAWENVPGVLSDKENAFGCFLAALVGESEALVPSGEKWTDAGCVYGPTRSAAWRVLDAQYFGLAQRRRRVFLVASARKGFDPASVLFESEGLRRDTPPSRVAQEDIAGTLEASIGRSRGAGISPGVLQPVAGTLLANGKAAGSATQQDAESDLLIPFSSSGQGYWREGIGPLRARAQDSHENLVACIHGTQDPIVSIDQAHALGRNNGQENALIAFDTTQVTSQQNRSNPQPGDPCHPLAAGAHPPAIAYGIPGNWVGRKPANGGNAVEPHHNISPCLTSTDQHCVSGVGIGVRRLLPIECERLQGFQDNYTLIDWDGWRKLDESETPESCIAEGLEVRQAKRSGNWYVKDADGPRYKALGNSKAVPVVRWLGGRIKAALGYAE